MASAPNSEKEDDRASERDSLEKSLKMSPVFHIVLIIEIFFPKKSRSLCIKSDEYSIYCCRFYSWCEVNLKTVILWTLREKLPLCRHQPEPLDVTSFSSSQRWLSLEHISQSMTTLVTKILIKFYE